MFRVFAEDVQPVFQDVEAASVKEAYALASDSPDNWQQYDEHDSHGITLSGEVEDLATDECFRVDGPTHCRTCSDEMADTINESKFGDGECGPCEYRRYCSQPDLLDACYLAQEEIEQWDETMGGSDDPRTKEALDALQSATRKAHGKAK